MTVAAQVPPPIRGVAPQLKLPSEVLRPGRPGLRGVRIPGAVAWVKGGGAKEKGATR